MKLVLTDMFGTTKTIKNATIIPKVGERIAWSYIPAPTVESVLYDYDVNTVLVALK